MIFALTWKIKKFLLKVFDTDEEDSHNGKDKNDDRDQQYRNQQYRKQEKQSKFSRFQLIFSIWRSNAEAFETDSVDKEELCNKKQVYINDFFLKEINCII